MVNQKFIAHDFNLPNHTNELVDAEHALIKVRDKLTFIKKQKSFSPKQHTKMFDRTAEILSYVGSLSKPALELGIEIENLYTIHYMKFPHLAKRLWQEHHASLNAPYNVIKNRCFRMFNELDETYIKLNKVYPPNWKM